MLKSILRKVLGKSCLTYEEMVTVLCDAEYVLNSRPLTYLSEDSNDYKALTPNMFLHDLKEMETTDLNILNQISLTNQLNY